MDSEGPIEATFLRLAASCDASRLEPAHAI
jgi:hypothetical protein